MIESGGFLDRVPPGCDPYLLSHIIHDWTEAECLTILGHCRRALAHSPPFSSVIIPLWGDDTIIWMCGSAVSRRRANFMNSSCLHWDSHTGWMLKVGYRFKPPMLGRQSSSASQNPRIMFRMSAGLRSGRRVRVT